MEWIYIFPSLLSTAIDGGPHSVGYFGFTLGLLLEFFIAAILIRLLAINLSFRYKENEKTVVIAVLSFFLGCIVTLTGEIDQKFAEIIFTSAATLAAAFFGAKYAFSLQNRKQENDEISKRVEAGNRAIFKLVNFYTKFCNFRDQFINELRDDSLRYIAIKPAIGMDMPSEIDFDSLTFILQSKDPDILGELSLLQAEVQSTIELIKIRSDIHMKVVQPKLEAATKENHEIRVDQIRNILGEAICVTLTHNTDQMIEFTDRIINDTDLLITKFRKALKGMFKGHLIVGFQKNNVVANSPTT